MDLQVFPSSSRAPGLTLSQEGLGDGTVDKVCVAYMRGPEFSSPVQA